MESLAILIALGIAALPFLQGIRIVPEMERGVVMRFGRLYGVVGPGLQWIIPGVDRLIRIDLNRHVPDWQSLPESELEARLRQLVLSGQLPTAI